MLRTLLLVALSAAAPVSAAWACSCMATDVIHSYQVSDHVEIAQAVSVRRAGNVNIWTFTLRKDLKECARPGTNFEVATPASVAACGTSFVRGQTYLLFADDVTIGGRNVYGTTQCAGNLPIGQLSPADRDYLESRPLFCAGAATCVDGTQPYNCFVDPCTVAAACPGAMCESNYCGGCTAEWYDPFGYGQCLPW